MESLFKDVSFALRMLRKSPGFTLTAILTLALAIGANTAIFGAVDAVLLRPLPYAHPEQLVRMYDVQPETPRATMSYPDIVDLKQRLKSFSSLTAWSNDDLNLTGLGEPESIRAMRVMGNFFSTLGVPLAKGKTWEGDEEVVGRGHLVVVTEGFLRQRMGGDLAAVGRSLQLGGESYTVVGVTPASFKFPGRAELFVPLVAGAREQGRGNHFLQVIARRNPSTSAATAKAELDQVMDSLSRQYPDTNSSHGAIANELHDDLVGTSREMLWLLLGAVVFVLLIACANVANLLLARAASREREVAIRAALGAGRGRLIRQFLLESVTLGLLGGGLGLLVSLWGVDLLKGLLPNGINGDEVCLNGRVLLFTFGLSLVAGLAFGLFPALQVSQVDLHTSLKSGHGSARAAVSRHPLRNALVIAQVAFALVPLVGAGLMVRSLIKLQTTPLGFDTANVLSARVTLTTLRYGDGERRAAFFRDVLGHLRALPEVESAAFIDTLPMGGSYSDGDIEVEGNPAATPGNEPLAALVVTSPQYFQAVHTRVLRGRALDETDTAQSRPVMMVNQAFVRRLLGSTDPLTRRGRAHWTDKEPMRDIVGVVEDTRVLDVTKPDEPRMYFPLSQHVPTYGWLVVHARGAPAAVASRIKDAVASVDSEQAIYAVQPLEEVVQQSNARKRTTVWLLGAFAVLALVLASVGIYGVMAYTVNQRTRELGVRMALGARAEDVLRLVLGQGVRLAALGVALGAVGALAGAKIVASLLYGVEPHDPLTFLGVMVCLLGVAVLASYVPARRATRVDPAISLRSE